MTFFVKGILFFAPSPSKAAQTITLSFILVIAVGTLVLMMQFTTVDGKGLPFVDSLFTTTSAVCVTGLVVVDTATVFTVWGQVVILLLIQIGGLGIMILSFFTIFVFRQSVSVESKLLISYMLSENNMTTLSSALRRIILITFGIELGGALLLLPAIMMIGAAGLFRAPLERSRVLGARWKSARHLNPVRVRTGQNEENDQSHRR